MIVSPGAGFFAVTSVTSVTKPYLQGFLHFYCGDKGRFVTDVTA